MIVLLLLLPLQLLLIAIVLSASRTREGCVLPAWSCFPSYGVCVLFRHWRPRVPCLPRQHGVQGWHQGKVSEVLVSQTLASILAVLNISA